MKGSFPKRFISTVQSILWQDTFRFNQKNQLNEGSFGIAGQYILDIHKVLSSFSYPHFHQLMKLNLRYLEMKRFTVDHGDYFPFENLRQAALAYAHKIPPTLCGSRSEMHNDDLLLLRLIPLMPYLWQLAKKNILTETRSYHLWQAYIGITHQHLRSFAAAFLFTLWLNALHQTKFKPSLMQRKKQLRDIVKHSLDRLKEHPHFNGQMNHFAQLFPHRTLPVLNLEQFGETERIKDRYIVHGLVNTISIVLGSKSFVSAIETAKHFDAHNVVLHASVAAVAAPFFAHRLNANDIKKVPLIRNFLSSI